MNKSLLLGAIFASATYLTSASTHAALINNGGGLIYDDVLDITWAQPNVFGSSWTDVKNIWAPGLTLGGVDGWRLPYISVATGAIFLRTGSVACELLMMVISLRQYPLRCGY